MKISNVIFYVRDIVKSKEFYKLLGFNTDNTSKFINYNTNTPGTYFSLMEANDPIKEPGKQVCVFYSSDIDNLYNKLKVANVTFSKELYIAPFGKTFSIRDLDGNKIEFVEQK